MYYTPLKHGFLTYESARRVLYVLYNFNSSFHFFVLFYVSYIYIFNFDLFSLHFFFVVFGFLILIQLLLLFFASSVLQYSNF